MYHENVRKIHSFIVQESLIPMPKDRINLEMALNLDILRQITK